MELTSEKVMEAFDIGGKEQAVAEPANGAGNATETPEAGSVAPDTGSEAEAQTADAGSSGPNDAGTAGTSEENTPPEGGTGGLSPEEKQRRDNAARRRRAETQEAISRAVKAEQERATREMADFFRDAGLKNTMTGEPITNMEQFREWKRSYDAAKVSEQLKSGKLTAEGLEAAISATPTVARMREMLQREEAARKAAEEQAAQERIEAELAEIQKLDPSIREVRDLLTMPNAQAFYDYVKRGNTFYDAFRLANWQTLTDRAAEAARQSAMRNTRSKDHLTPNDARGAGAESVPAEQLRLFHAFNPGATDAEIQAYYNRGAKQ